MLGFIAVMLRGWNAERAEREARRAAAWAGRAVLEFRCANGDWAGALDALDNNMASGLLDKTTFRRQRAVLLTAQALQLIEHDPLCAATYNALMARGTPVMLVRGRRLVGFSAQAVADALTTRAQ